MHFFVIVFIYVVLEEGLSALLCSVYCLKFVFISSSLALMSFLFPFQFSPLFTLIHKIGNMLKLHICYFYHIYYIVERECVKGGVGTLPFLSPPSSLTQLPLAAISPRQGFRHPSRVFDVWRYVYH